MPAYRNGTADLSFGVRVRKSPFSSDVMNVARCAYYARRLRTLRIEEPLYRIGSWLRHGFEKLRHRYDPRPCLGSVCGAGAVSGSEQVPQETWARTSTKPYRRPFHPSGGRTDPSGIPSRPFIPRKNNALFPWPSACSTDGSRYFSGKKYVPAGLVVRHYGIGGAGSLASRLLLDIDFARSRSGWMRCEGVGS
jgi:hypothetical protein